jgi:chemotaxis signal transduction protein
MSASASLPDHRLLLVDHEERIIGLAVDDIKAVVAGVLLRSTQDSGLAEMAQPFVTGAVTSADGGFRCLDVDAVIATCMA